MVHYRWVFAQETAFVIVPQEVHTSKHHLLVTGFHHWHHQVNHEIHLDHHSIYSQIQMHSSS